MLENEGAFETAEEAKNPNENFDCSLLQSLFLISVLLILLYVVYNILLNIYFFSFFLYEWWIFSLSYMNITEYTVSKKYVRDAILET